MISKEHEFRLLFDELSNKLTPQDVEGIEMLVEVGELRIAVENFCTQLYERDATLTVDQISRLIGLGQDIRIDPSYWSILRRS